MEITNIEALIAQGKILKPTDLDPANDYLIVGKFQNGNRKKGGDGNNYPAYVIPAGSISTSKSFASFGSKNLQSTTQDTATLVKLDNGSLPYNTPDITLSGAGLTTINFATAGVYNFELIIQALRSTVGASNENMRVWLRQNTVDVPTTTKVVNFSRFPEESETIISLSYYVQVAAGDKVQIMWSVSDKFIEITPIGGNSAQPNPDAYPAGDCVTLNINKIS